MRRDATPPSQNPIISGTVGDTFTLVGPEITLTQADLPYAAPPGGSKITPATTDVFIYADTVTLAGPLRNPGRNLQIVARCISIAAGASIDVSGADAQQTFAAGDVAHQADETPGADGVPGTSGTDGGKAGSIVLYAESFSTANGAVLALNASGAPGGRGQDGHGGVTGQNGTWVPVQPWSRYSPGLGQPGGGGGFGGNGGNGGAAGSITVGIVEGIDAASVTMTTIGGTAGIQGAVGRGADGGHGAPYDPHYSQYKGSEGRQGQTPDERSAYLHTPTAGANGTSSLLSTAQFGYPQMSAAVVLPQLNMLQQTADSTFLRRDFTTAANLYHLLMALTAGAAGVTVGGAPAAGPPSTDPQVAARAAIYEACRTELSRMRQGLDFFGYAPDWVPALTLASLQGEIDGLLALAAQLEASMVVLGDNAKSAGDRKQALTDAQTKATASLTAAQRQLASIKTSLTAFESSLAAQDAQIQAQVLIIDMYSYQFDNAFEKDHDNCTPSNALTAVQTVVTIGSSMYGDAGDVIDAGEAVEGAYEAGSVMDGVKNGIKFAQTCASTWDAMKSGYGQIKTMIDNTPQYPDIAKMFVNQDDFDAQMAQYVDKYASAKELKDAVDHYYDLVKARGKTVLSYNAMYLQRHRLEAECAQRQAAFEVTQAQLASDTQVIGPGYASFVQDADLQCRTYLLRKITEEQHAYQYWTLDDDGDGGGGIAEPTDDRLEALEAVHEAIVEGIDDWRSGVGRPFEAYTGIQMRFSRADHPSAFATLDKLQKLVITADIAADGDGFANLFHVLAEKMRVNVTDDQGRTTSNTTANVVHGGSSTFMALDNTPRTFTHALRVTYCASHVDGALGDASQGYTGLSPFTEWSIDLSLDKALFAPGARPIDSVTLEFDGQFLGPNALVRARAKAKAVTRKGAKAEV